MMDVLINLLCVVVAFVSMEAVAWLAHKYIMHGLLWALHRDHHVPAHHRHLQRNDFFFIIFAVPAMALMLAGFDGFTPPFWLGVGITCYGFAYFVIHEVFIHQRIKIWRNAKSPYLRAIRRAHKMHHRHTGREHGECFGMLWAPLKYFREAKNQA